MRENVGSVTVPKLGLGFLDINLQNFFISYLITSVNLGCFARDKKMKNKKNLIGFQSIKKYF